MMSKKIVKLTPNNRQTLLFSATMPMAIRELSEMFLKDPVSVTVSPVSSTAEKVEQRVYFVDKTEKRNLLHHLITKENLSDVLVFSRTKHGADNVVKALRKKRCCRRSHSRRQIPKCTSACFGCF